MDSLQTTHSNAVITGNYTNPFRCNGDADFVATLKDFWETEPLGILEETTYANEASNTGLFLQSIHFRDGRYEIQLPWKESHPDIPNHLSLCKIRLRSLLKRFKFNPKLFQEYDKIIKEQL